MGRDFYDVALRDFERNEATRERRQQECKRCTNCGDPIEQSRAVHIVLNIRNKPVDLWLCDDCVEDFYESTGYDDDE